MTRGKHLEDGMIKGKVIGNFLNFSKGGTFVVSMSFLREDGAKL